MSNYPSNYPQYPQQPPGPQGPLPYGQGYYGYQDPLAQSLGRCKRAGILQIVLASISLLCGGCFAAVSPFMTLEMITQANVTLPPELNVDMLRKVYLLLGIGLVVFGIVLIILGTLVMRASRGAAIAAMIINILGALLMVVSAALQLAKGSALEAMINIAIMVILVWLIIWLAQASLAAGQVAAARAQSSYFPQAQTGYGYPYGQPQQQQQQWPSQQPQQQQQWPPPQQQQPPAPQQWPPPPQPPQPPPPQ